MHRWPHSLGEKLTNSVLGGNIQTSVTGLVRAECFATMAAETDVEVSATTATLADLNLTERGAAIADPCRPTR